MVPRGNFPSDKADQFPLRLPDGMREAVKAAAKANNRTMNAEIVSRIEANAETLRDRFAMAALTGLCLNGAQPDYCIPDNVVASIAYRFADAMLAERQKGGA